MLHKYGWIKQGYDERDLVYSLGYPVSGFKPSDDVTSQLPDCWDQGQTSSCTVHGISAPIWSGMVLAGLEPIMPSRLAMYWWERDKEGDVNQDGGAIIRDGIKVCNQIGIAPENLWPFDPSKLFVKPTQDVYDAAIKDRIHFYASINLVNLNQVKLAISHKLPIVFGFQVYEYFESAEMARTGVLKVPEPHEGCVGGHCVAIVGYDDTTKTVLVRNSWGMNWGLPSKTGHFTMPYEYLTSSMCSDAWVIRFK